MGALERLLFPAGTSISTAANPPMYFPILRFASMILSEFQNGNDRKAGLDAGSTPLATPKSARPGICQLRWRHRRHGPGPERTRHVDADGCSRRSVPLYPLSPEPSGPGYACGDHGLRRLGRCAGRAGVRFSDLPEEARRRLRQWLTANATAPSRKAPKLSFDEPMWAALGVSSPANGRQPLAISLEAESGGSTEHGPNGNSRTVQYEFNSLGSDLNAALKLISERACSITRGSGSAIAIANRNGMRCRARVGENAPPVGTELDISCGLSGECVSGGKALRCDDTENDPRVDFETCQLLGIRSVLAAPIRYDQRTVGVLEVFSNHPFAFDEGDLAVAERLAQTVILTMTRAGAL